MHKSSYDLTPSPKPGYKYIHTTYKYYPLNVPMNEQLSCAHAMFDQQTSYNTFRLQKYARSLCVLLDSSLFTYIGTSLSVEYSIRLEQ